MKENKPVAKPPTLDSQAMVNTAVTNIQQKVGVQQVVKKLPGHDNTRMKFIAAGLVTILVGIATGWFVSGASAGTTTPTANVSENPKGGSVDESMFPDSAQGTLHEGGIEGEGTHHLDTGAGAEKYVYLLSTVLDLNSFVDKKVEVYGQTLAAEHAGWLMDVGRVKVIE
jgi:hypothetical protein